MNAAELIEHVKESAQQVGMSLGEGEDWAPVTFFVGEDTVHLGLVDGSCLATADTKRHLFTVLIPDQIREFQASAYAYVFSTWQLRVHTHGDQDKAVGIIDLANMVGVRNMPGRSEVLTAFAADKNDTQYWTADITRDEQGVPSLGEWEQWPAEGRVEGYMVEAPVVALRGLEDK